MARARPRPEAPSILDGYAPLAGAPDELVDGQEGLRPGWAALIAHLQGQAPEERLRNASRGVQHLADAGVFFRAYGDPTAAARDWPMSTVPILLGDAEWEGIEAGLIQRADLLEAVVADLYGPNRLAAAGLLPAALIARSPEWLRPLVGTAPRGGHFLHFVAFEIGRGEGGRWRVLSDRTDAPSGAGFALETRVAATHVHPDLHRRSRVHRLAGFFRDFRDALEGLSGDGAARVGILTPGALTDTYYEQAYIARYLGLALLEGGDLAVRDGALHLRTVQGLAPVDVLWRRMDGGWADPLELREGSRIGTPGLVQAIRQGRVTMVNALGAGILETQALMAFLPAICERLTGEALRMPGIPTWWCGDPEARAHVRREAGRMTVGPALGVRLPHETGAPHAVAGSLRNLPEGEAGRDVDDWIEEGAGGLVGQELVTLSTTPVWDRGRLVPRPMTIRVFLARTPSGWRAMPGGFGRVGRRADPAAVAMREGGSAADVWVVSDRPTEPVSLLAAHGAPFARAVASPLPSRAADNLFWVGRYVERTEGLVRLQRAWHSREAEGADAALLARIGGLLDDYGVDPAKAVPEGLEQAMASAVRAAGAIRDRFSVDGWAALKDLQKTAGRMAGTAAPGLDASLAMSVLLRKLSGFSGLVHENMMRGPGWQFLSLGRSLERALMMAEMLAALADPGAPPGALDAAVEIGDSVMTHRQRYAATATRDAVVDLLALDDTNPRAVRFHVLAMADRLAALADGGRDAALALRGRVEGIGSALGEHTTRSLDTAALRATRGAILSLTGAVGETFLH